MNIIEKFQYHSKREEWELALPLIEEIVSRSESFSTSWFNYGICLEGLGRFTDAVNAFTKAYQLEPEDYHCQYRIFRNLYLAKDICGFVGFAKEEYPKTPEIIELISEDIDFGDIVKTDEYCKFISEILQ